MNAIHWPGAEGLEQVPFRRLFKAIRREVPENAAIVTAYTDGQVTLRANRSKIGYHEAANLDGYQGVEPGDFVVHGLDIMRGSVGVSDSRGAISSVCTICTPLRELDLRYVAYVIREQAFSGFPKALARGVREGGADFRRWDTLAELPIPAIDDGMQRVIADYLDRETAEIDAFVAESEKLITLLNERRASVITQAVTKGLDPSVPMKDSGVDWLGVIPANWRIMAFARGARISNGADYKDVELAEGGYPVYGSGGEFRRASAYLYDGESVLFGRKGTVNRPILVSGKFWTVDTMFYSQINRSIWLPKFVYYWATILPYDLWSTSTALPSMTSTAILAASVPTPSAQEQTQIAQYLDEQTAKIDEAIATAREAIALANERRQALISAAVTGKIDVRTAA